MALRGPYAEYMNYWWRIILIASRVPYEPSSFLSLNRTLGYWKFFGFCFLKDRRLKITPNESTVIATLWLLENHTVPLGWKSIRSSHTVHLVALARWVTLWQEFTLPASLWRQSSHPPEPLRSFSLINLFIPEPLVYARLFSRHWNSIEGLQVCIHQPFTRNF